MVFSGDGELLGMVVDDPLTCPIAEDYPYTTLLGQDPIRAQRAAGVRQ